MSADLKFSETAAHVRAHDRDRYLAALFAPRAVREGLMALYAFNCELERIPDLVSEPMLGEIRLQWWRDVLDGPRRDTATGNPLADAMAQAIEKHGLPVALLRGMIDARSADLDGGGFADIQALNAYLYKSEGAVFALSAQCAGVPVKQATPAANAAAIARGIAGILLRLPRDAAAGRVMLPLSLLAGNGVTAEEILAGEGSQGLEKVVDELAGLARAALGDARAKIASLPRAARGVFAPLATVERTLALVEKPGMDPLHDVVELNPLRRFIGIWRTSRSGRV